MTDQKGFRLVPITLEKLAVGDPYVESGDIRRVSENGIHSVWKVYRVLPDDSDEVKRRVLALLQGYMRVPYCRSCQVSRDDPHHEEGTEGCELAAVIALLERRGG